MLHVLVLTPQPPNRLSMPCVALMVARGSCNPRGRPISLAITELIYAERSQARGGKQHVL